MSTPKELIRSVFPKDVANTLLGSQKKESQISTTAILNTQQKAMDGLGNKPPQGNIVLPTTANTVPKVPTDWLSLGAESGYNPKSAEELNLWVVGPSGEGKTTFISSIPDQVILDFDNSAGSIIGSRAIRIPVKGYEHYEQIVQTLIKEGKENKHKVRRVTIDTVDEWVGMIINRLQYEKGCEDITEFGAQGHGWALIRERCWSKLRELEEAGYVWTLVGHMVTKTETHPLTNKERTVIRDAIFPTMSAKIVRSSDFKLTIYCINREIEKKVKQKVAGTGQIIEVVSGTEIQSIYYLDSYTTAEREGKGRAAPGMTRKFEIPQVGAWDIFKKNYDESVVEAKKQYA